MEKQLKIQKFGPAPKGEEPEFPCKEKDGKILATFEEKGIKDCNPCIYYRQEQGRLSMNKKVLYFTKTDLECSEFDNLCAELSMDEPPGCIIK